MQGWFLSPSSASRSHFPSLDAASYAVLREIEQDFYLAFQQCGRVVWQDELVQLWADRTLHLVEFSLLQSPAVLDTRRK